ncbi:MAG TPA: DMT family transporter [Flavisolibacter sp.]|nr:DMT family transporter [Flavisolibacter sp.]
MKERAGKQKLAGFIMTLSGAILFSTKAIFVKQAFGRTGVDPVTLLTLRMLFSLPFFLAAAVFVSSREANIKMTRRQWLLTLAVGFLGYYLSSLFDFIGLQYISAGLERLILFLYPTFAVLINRGIFGQKISRIQMGALLLTYAGILAAFVGELRLNPGGTGFYWGSFMVFLCALTYSAYLVGSGRLVPQLGSTKFTAYAMLSATAGVFLHFAFQGNYDVLAQRELWWYGILLAVLATVLPSFLLAGGMKRIGSNNVAILLSIGPVSTIIQAHYVLGEAIIPAQIAGTALVVAGVLLLGWKEKE